MAIPQRTVKDIHTNSGRVDQISQPYRAFMRISVLEMEKVRRGRERKSAMQRIHQIDARFREIGAEKKVLLERLSEGTKKFSWNRGASRKKNPARLSRDSRSSTRSKKIC